MNGRTAACFAMSWFLAGQVSAQEATDALYLTGRLEAAGGATGQGGAVEWHHLEPRHGGVQLGISSASLADTTLRYGRVGGQATFGRVTASGTGDIGAGRQAANRFGYRRLATGVDVAASPKLSLGGELQMLSLSITQPERVLRASLSWHAAAPTIVQVGYSTLFSGGTTSPAVSARVDVVRKPVTAIAGLIVGAHRSAFGDTGSIVSASREFFAGCQRNIRGIEVLGIFDATTSPARSARTIVVIRIALPNAKAFL
jgi:hypothetical protein